MAETKKVLQNLGNRKEHNKAGWRRIASPAWMKLAVSLTARWKS
ncbi:hypothetical protein [Oscillospiraceae bacterium]|nr:hypothetical protein [Oscillospiraceae bacterium]